MARSHQEHIEQCALFEWATYNSRAMPLLLLLYAIPNGGSRNLREGVRLKREGVKAGMPDVHLPVARRGFHSFYIELKAPATIYSEAGRVLKHQAAKHEELRAVGNRVEVCFGWRKASELLAWYLS